MKIASLFWLPCAAWAFSPLANNANKATVVQNVLSSKWTMMPDEPKPEVCSTWIGRNVKPENIQSIHAFSYFSIYFLLQIDPRRKDPDEKPPANPVRMPVIDTDNGQMDVISRLLKDRILLLGQGVDDEVANVLVAQLLYLANEDPEKDITLYINSPVRQ